MPRVHSFEPISNSDARVLILGSMPGRASLTAEQYYAHPRNVFWRIMSELLHLDPAAAYATRVEALKSARIALWDVLQSCTRRGSLDSEIQNATVRVNDFRTFLRNHRDIRHVFFNGATAEVSYRRHVLPRISSDSITYRRLPSTSPANASMSFESKLDAWRAALTHTGTPSGSSKYDPDYN